MNPETVRDKDGLSATVAMLGMVAEARGRGATLRDLLREFDETFGSFASDQISIRVDDLAVIGQMMSALRAHRPAEVGGVEVTQIDDLLEGASEFPPSDVLRLWLADGSRLIVRPSGTEPKLKLYLDVRGDSAERCPGEDRIARRRREGDARRRLLRPVPTRDISRNRRLRC